MKKLAGVLLALVLMGCASGTGAYAQRLKSEDDKKLIIELLIRVGKDPSSFEIAKYWFTMDRDGNARLNILGTYTDDPRCWEMEFAVVDDLSSKKLSWRETPVECYHLK